MTPERFAAILDAYGADPRRWPDAEREAARAMASARADALAEADALDAWLDHAPRPVPSEALRQRVIAAVGAVGRRGRLWWDRLTVTVGVGWAAAACAGVVAGVGLTRQLAAEATADAVLYQASLGLDEGLIG